MLGFDAIEGRRYTDPANPGVLAILHTRRTGGKTSKLPLRRRSDTGQSRALNESCRPQVKNKTAAVIRGGWRGPNGPRKLLVEETDFTGRRSRRGGSAARAHLEASEHAN